MDKLDKIRTKLTDFPQGATVSQLMEALKMKRSSLYEELLTLENQSLIYHEGKLYYPKKPEKQENHKQKPLFTAQEAASLSYFRWRGSEEGGGVRFFKKFVDDYERLRKEKG